MRSVKSFIAAGAATLLSQAAFAADMAIAPPPYAPAVVEDFGGWYLRGDIGFSNQRVDRLNNALDSTLTSSVQNNNFSTAGIFGLGVGYKVNNWFRADVTGEYRGNSQFLGKDASPMPAVSAPIPITPPSHEWVVLANAYVDLGTWWCITPFIGAGVGGARVSINELHRSEHHQSIWRPRTAGCCLRRQRRRSGISPGPRMPVSPTRSRRTSPSNSPIAISTWATA